MGNLSSKLAFKAILLGLDSAGKTSVLKALTNQEIPEGPTPQWNYGTLKSKGGEILLWDMGGQERLRTFWRQHYHGVGIIIYVVDSADTSRLQQSKDELQAILHEEELFAIPIIIIANKQDQIGALTPEELAIELEIHLLEPRDVIVIPCCAKPRPSHERKKYIDEGILECREWIKTHAVRAEDMDKHIKTYNDKVQLLKSSETSHLQSLTRNTITLSHTGTHMSGISTTTPSVMTTTGLQRHNTNNKHSNNKHNTSYTNVSTNTYHHQQQANGSMTPGQHNGTTTPYAHSVDPHSMAPGTYESSRSVPVYQPRFTISMSSNHRPQGNETYITLPPPQVLLDNGTVISAPTPGAYINHSTSQSQSQSHGMLPVQNDNHALNIHSIGTTTSSTTLPSPQGLGTLQLTNHNVPSSSRPPSSSHSSSILSHLTSPSTPTAASTTSMISPFTHNSTGVASPMPISGTTTATTTQQRIHRGSKSLPRQQSREYISQQQQQSIPSSSQTNTPILSTSNLPPQTTTPQQQHVSSSGSSSKTVTPTPPSQQQQQQQQLQAPPLLLNRPSYDDNDNDDDDGRKTEPTLTLLTNGRHSRSHSHSSHIYQATTPTSANNQNHASLPRSPSRLSPRLSPHVVGQRNSDNVTSSHDLHDDMQQLSIKMPAIHEDVSTTTTSSALQGMTTPTACSHTNNNTTPSILSPSQHNIVAPVPQPSSHSPESSSLRHHSCGMLLSHEDSTEHLDHISDVINHNNINTGNTTNPLHLKQIADIRRASSSSFMSFHTPEPSIEGISDQSTTNTATTTHTLTNNDSM